MEKQSELDFLRKQPLLEGLSDEQISFLIQNSKEENFQPNQHIIEEGDANTDIYIIKEGQVDVLKMDQENSCLVLINKLAKGETFGEMSFMDGSPRSATIKAAKFSTLIKLSKTDLSSVKPILSQIFSNIALINIKRLKNSNEVYIKNLRELEWLNKTQKNIGVFLIYLYLIMRFSFVLASHFTFKELQFLAPWVIGLVSTFFLIKKFGYSFSRFGFDFKNFFSIVITSLSIFFISVGVVWSLNPIFEAIFQSKIVFSVATLPQLFVFAFYSFAQEFIARGVLQTALQDFFNDVRGYKTLFLNLVFLSFLVSPTGLQTALEFILIGFAMGLLYLNQKSIFGVFLIHFLLLSIGILKV
jgi:CRP-like cAMP-binding protein